MKMRTNRAFTLLELLIVVGLIAALSAVLVGGLSGGSKSAALQAGQATLANLILSARTRAVSSGKRTRIIVQQDTGSAQDPARFLRMIVLQQGSQAGATPGTWTTLDTVFLPNEVYVMPRDPTVFAQLIDSTAQDWRRPANQSRMLGSSVFGGAPVAIDLLDGTPSATYQGVMFTERGTIARLDGGGTITDTEIEIIVALGTRLAPAQLSPGQAAVRLSDPNLIRGLSVSAYGVTALVNERLSF